MYIFDMHLSLHMYQSILPETFIILSTCPWRDTEVNPFNRKECKCFENSNCSENGVCPSTVCACSALLK